MLAAVDGTGNAYARLGQRRWAARFRFRLRVAGCGCGARSGPPRRRVVGVAQSRCRLRSRRRPVEQDFRSGGEQSSTSVSTQFRATSFSTATPPPAWTSPSAGERQSARLLRIGLTPGEQAERPLPRRRTGISDVPRCGMAPPRLLRQRGSSAARDRLSGEAAISGCGASDAAIVFRAQVASLERRRGSAASSRRSCARFRGEAQAGLDRLRRAEQSWGVGRC